MITDFNLEHHFRPRQGWMNDPNGFSYFRGAYHLFYQYNPYDTKWGPMHWGHWISDDLVHWQNAPVAMAPGSVGNIAEHRTAANPAPALTPIRLGPASGLPMTV